MLLEGFYWTTCLRSRLCDETRGHHSLIAFPWWVRYIHETSGAKWRFSKKEGSSESVVCQDDVPVYLLTLAIFNIFVSHFLLIHHIILPRCFKIVTFITVLHVAFPLIHLFWNLFVFSIFKTFFLCLNLFTCLSKIHWNLSNLFSQINSITSAILFLFFNWHE